MNLHSAELNLAISALYFPAVRVLFQVPSATVLSQEWLAQLLGNYYSLRANLQTPRRHSYICCQVHSSLKNKSRKPMQIDKSICCTSKTAFCKTFIIITAKKFIFRKCKTYYLDPRYIQTRQGKDNINHRNSA